MDLGNGQRPAYPTSVDTCFDPEMVYYYACLKFDAARRARIATYIKDEHYSAFLTSDNECRYHAVAEDHGRHGLVFLRELAGLMHDGNGSCTALVYPRDDLGTPIVESLTVADSRLWMRTGRIERADVVRFDYDTIPTVATLFGGDPA